MESLKLAVLVLCFVVVFAADNPTVNWSSDPESFPGFLLKKMYGKSDEEIQKAMTKSYESILKIITEYSSHVLDPESPLGFFKDEMPLPNTRSVLPQSDLAFINNNIRGLLTYSKNSIVLQWAPDQVTTEVVWKEANIRGKYIFINSTYFNQGKYHIQIQDMKYLSNTPLSDNTAAYPLSVPKSSMSYKSAKAFFTGGLPDVNQINNDPHIKYFLEDIVFQHVADRVARDMHNNITFAIRQAVKSVIVFKTDSIVDVPSFNGKLSSKAGFTVNNILINGLSNTENKVKKVTVKAAAKSAIVEFRITSHNLDGKFNLKIEESKPFTGVSNVTISRIDIILSFNILKTTECKTDVVLTNFVVKPPAGSKMTSDDEKVVANAFSNNLKTFFETNLCKKISESIKYKS
ncbi:uncharacterized protein LOC126906616 [Daktulosphaira vitifoliae]|uniref:uncharacterized protein LOC126906616 n=1 Tax=Daktulosphaira vitifoliae TaxID=58002 RepID=UPI0021AA1566|nr:uncharacterized protein LOC126906616 [Daktulosphaira vitifoliae]XP_050543247.1 uncharacterized protein LOC126906616 [Daktulosphaira vitifoliae]